MMRFSYSSIVMKQEDEERKPKKEGPRINKVLNPSWDLFQLFKQIEISMCGAKRIKGAYMMDWAMPESLKGSVEFKPPFAEVDLYEKVMNIFYSYLLENEKEMSVEDKRNSSAINTVILVEDKKVHIATSEEELIKKMKKDLKEITVAEDNRDSLLNYVDSKRFGND